MAYVLPALRDREIKVEFNASGMKTDVLAIGELLADVVTEEYVVSLREARSFKIFQGGSPANVCANLRWLGASTAMVSCVGNDGIGEFILDAMKHTGVATEFIVRSTEYPTSLVLVGKSKGTPEFIAYRMADRHLPPVDTSLIDAARIVHTCAFALSKSPARENILQALHRAKAQNKLVSVDWNYAPSIWPDDGRTVLDEIVALNPLLKMSLDDISRFEGRALSVEEARACLSRFNTEVLALTCGKDGVWYRSGEGEWHFKPAAAVTEVVDSTGAGDAFWAGFLWAYLRSLSLDECIDEALALAARKVQRLGPLYAAV